MIWDLLSLLKVENKEEIVKILLDADADPNAITVDERGPLLKPPLGEYFNSSEAPNCEIIRLLLKYGARIIIKVGLQWVYRQKQN